MKKEFALIMVSCIIGISSAYGDTQVNITQSPGQAISPFTVANSTNNVLFQVLTGGQAIIDEFIQFSGSGLTALRTYVFPDSDGTVVLEDTSQTLTQKTIDADFNAISNIDDAEIKNSAGIDVSKLSGGSVDNSEFDRLDGLVADIQPQLNGKVDNAANVGTGFGWFKQKSGIDLQFKSVTAGSNIVITPSADEIQISATSSGGEVNTASNLGTGRNTFKQKIGVDLQFRSLTQGQGITLTENSDDISIGTNFKIDGISQSCTGTDKVSAISYNNVTGDTIITCSSDQTGVGSGIPLPSNKKHGYVIPSDATPLGAGILEGAVFGGTELFGDDTDGVRISTTTGTTGTEAGVQSVSNSICHLEWNCYLDARVQQTVITGGRLFVGFSTVPTLPNSDTTFCDSGSCFGFWTKTTDAVVQLIRNDGDATADETITSLTEDTAVHRYQVYAKAASNEFCYKIDSGSETCFSTEIPAATTDLYIHTVFETSDTTSDVFEYYYVYAENDK